MKLVQGFYWLGILSTRPKKLVPQFDSAVVVGMQQSQFHEADSFRLLYRFLSICISIRKKRWLNVNEWRRRKNIIMFFALFYYIHHNIFLYIKNLVITYAYIQIRFIASCGVIYMKAYTDIQWCFNSVAYVGTFAISL